MKNRKVRLICMSFDGEYKGEGIHDQLNTLGNILMIWEANGFSIPFIF